MASFQATDFAYAFSEQYNDGAHVWTAPATGNYLIIAFMGCQKGTITLNDPSFGSGCRVDNSYNFDNKGIWNPNDSGTSNITRVRVRKVYMPAGATCSIYKQGFKTEGNVWVRFMMIVLRVS